ncbi:MAG: RCC1 domain-containing protein [Polyangiales bacterium]
MALYALLVCSACAAPRASVESQPTTPAPQETTEARPPHVEVEVPLAPPEPPARAPLPRETKRPALALGAQHSCLLSAQGEIFCWGANRFGQLGHGGEMGYREFETRPQRVGEGYIRIAGGTWNTCGLREDGQVDCWGHGGFGQLGGERLDSPSPLRMDVDDVVEMAVGGGHICLLRRDSTLWCRGDNAMGQLGLSERGAHPSFENVGFADSVYAGRAHTCVRDGAELSCFGENLDAQLGSGERSDAQYSRTPVLSVGASETYRGFALGGGHSCVVRGDHGYCWGRNDSFQLGAAATEDEGPTRYVPAPFDVGVVDELALGARFTCALAEGRVQCMGLGHRGQIGDGGRRMRRTWTRVPNLRDASHVATGAEHACAVSRGSVRCWGSGRRGQLGDAHSEDRARPVRVVGLRRDQLQAE